MPEPILNRQETLAGLPPEWPDDPMPKIRSHLDQSATKIVILDDDPTGTQTVHSLPVLTRWDTDRLTEEIGRKDRAFFVLTNSRGLTKDKAIALAGTLGRNLKAACEKTGVPLSIISRSDSTLRGHFPCEVDEMADTMGILDHPYLVFPFFEEGQRITLDNIHYVAQDDQLVPAAQTPYARDASFGFTQSDLCRWVEEKTRGRISAENVVTVGIRDIRLGGPDKVCNLLTGVPQKGACIINAVSYRDVEVVVQGLLTARKKGKHFLYRTAASFVRVRTGTMPKSTCLEKADLVSGTRNGGLFVVGSYVPKTTAQLEQLLKFPDVVPVEINVKLLLDPLQRLSAIRTAALDINRALKNGQDTVLFTSRELIKSNDPSRSLEIGQIISQSLIRVVQMLDCQPGYLVAKGGITSSDVATVGLRVERALVKGQVLPGVPVWELGEESVYPGMSYIIFPGNVGEDNALVTIQKKLRQHEGSGHA